MGHQSRIRGLLMLTLDLTLSIQCYQGDTLLFFFIIIVVTTVTDAVDLTCSGNKV